MCETVLKDLIDMKNTHSKMKNLHYEKLEMSQYLKVSDKWSASSAFKFRTLMSEVGENFKGKYGSNPICPMANCKERDSQEHLSACSVLQQEAGIKMEDDVCYADLFGKQPKKVIKVAKFMELSLQKRSEILETARLAIMET